ncbi:hypothetical protein GBA52_027494 [Prunus armeniaca]|nr:hypothetical protein GBA52_027494 [Prunus armeniaca]
MKLRVRSIETKETLRVEVPNLCSLHQLKLTISQLISASPSSLRLSLNRRDELHASSPDDSLHSLGLTSGDLIFYTVDPSSQTLALPPHSISHSSVQSHNQILTTGVPQGSNFQNPETLIGEGSAAGDLIAEEQRSLVSNSETLVASGPESMEIDDGSDGIGLKKYSVPFFLKRVLREELGEDRSNHKLLVIAVHAAVLESGFVGFDSVSGMGSNRFHLADEWPRTAITMSISYTLPEILKNRGNNGNGVEGVMLKFQSLGRFVNVYGSLASGGAGPYRVCLDERRFGPIIESVWENRNVNERDGFVSEREVFEFWKIVKDGITLPLLIDLCAKAGLPAPPSLMRLPPELKMKILEPLSGVDIAKVGGVCKELRNLANNDELWKKKYAEEFGSGTGGEGTMINWKHKFARNWEIAEQQRKAVGHWRSYERPYFNRIRRDPNPLFVPSVTDIIGGDYDRFPVFGALNPTGQPHPILQPPRRFPARRNFSPNCNLEGFLG